MLNPVRSTIKETDIIDVHVHVGGPPNENESMYFWSNKFKKSISFEGIKLVTKLQASNITAYRYISVVFDQLKASKYVDKAVLLALDRFYTEDGKENESATHLFVANDYLATLSQIDDEFLFGCSVHPYSPDALERLWKCAKRGAVLCKWLPSSQGIDPTHPLSVKFYRALALLKLPLLMHVGPEVTIPTDLNEDKAALFNSAAGDYAEQPGDSLLLALGEGAAVIVAHCGIPLGKMFDKDNDTWEGVFKILRERYLASPKYKRLFGDLSAFCIPGRYKYIKTILPLAKAHPEKFLYGSDYPIPVVSMSDGKGLDEIIKAFGWLARRALPQNDLDKNYQLLKKQFPAGTFSAAAKALRHPHAEIPSFNSFCKSLGLMKRRWFFWKKPKQKN
ncbi:MAG: amidohydrolase family protein [Candidatus Aminicenantes bacterium]|nr:amidohydrolase family protein [Candidatus Aminicenantes bacterium]